MMSRKIFSSKKMGKGQGVLKAKEPARCGGGGEQSFEGREKKGL